MILVEATREINGVISQQSRYYLSDLGLLPAVFNVDDKESMKSRRRLAGWDDQYLLKVLTLF